MRKLGAKYTLKREVSAPFQLSQPLASEVRFRGRRKFLLKFGEAYLIKNDIEKAYEVFIEKVSSGSKGLIITREYPLKVRRKFGLANTPMVWLTMEEDENQLTINTLQDISILISQFIQKTPHGIILLDGLEYLITNYGFERTIHFLQSKRSQIERTRSILITPILPEALLPQQAKLIERETKTLNLTRSTDHFRYL